MAEKISDEEKEYYSQLKADKEAKKKKCRHKGCDTTLVPSNETGYCELHKDEGTKEDMRKWRGGWKKSVFLAIARLETEGKKIDRDTLEAALKPEWGSNLPLKNWLGELKNKGKDGDIEYDNGTTVYSRTSVERAPDEDKKIVDVLDAVESLKEEGFKEVNYSQIKERGDLTSVKALAGRDGALRKGYLTKRDPTWEITLTKKGRKRLQEYMLSENEEESTKEEGESTTQGAQATA